MDREPYAPNGAARASGSVITGRQLATLKRGKRARARLADRIDSGEVYLIDLTKSQIARLLGVSVAYVNVVRAERAS